MFFGNLNGSIPQMTLVFLIRFLFVLFLVKSQYTIYQDPKGLFLHYSGFDYKHEKTAGDKMFWKCKHFANMDYDGGCKGRIMLCKNGLIRVTKPHNHRFNGMNGFDGKSLKVFACNPILGSTNYFHSCQLDEDYVIRDMPRGGLLLDHQGHTYRCDRGRNNCKVMSYWRCQFGFTKKKCPGRVKIKDGKLEIKQGHNHEGTITK